MIARIFHGWERRLASVTTDRTVRPFEWGLDWLDGSTAGTPTTARSGSTHWAARRVSPTATRSSRCRACDDYELRRRSPDLPERGRDAAPENNTVVRAFFPACRRARTPARRARAAAVERRRGRARRALPADRTASASRALRLSLPYHDARMPPELRRADYIVSANVGRTLQVCRQAVLDARRAIAWLASQGYESIGILGTSLGSCLSMLTAAHEPLIKARGAQPHLAVLRRRRLGRALDAARARRTRRPRRSRPAAPDLAADLPVPVHRARARQADAAGLRALRSDVPGGAVTHAGRRVPKRGTSSTSVTVLPCGHYSTGVTPFKWMDG